MAVGDAYRLLPGADYIYHCDRRWWETNLSRVREHCGGQCVTQYRPHLEQQYGEKGYALANGIAPVEGKDKPGLGLDCIHFNMNSGAQAINLAYLLGARFMVLLGFDMKGNGHFHNENRQGLVNGPYHAYVKQYTQLASDLKAQGVEVVNCTRDTALTQFERADLGEVLCRI